LSKQIIGIDLGTTNCSMSHTTEQALDLSIQTPEIETAAIPQLVNPGEVRDEALLPSFLFIPGPSDFPKGTLELPWKADGPVAGYLAQKRGSEAPARLISSAKSWLSYAGVDRNAPILPVNATAGVEKL